MTSVSLLGVPFSVCNNLLLKAVKRTQGYHGDVWISVPIVEILGLRLRENAKPATALTAENGVCLYHHSSEFTQPLGEIQNRWRLYAVANDASRPEVVQAHANQRRRRQLHRGLHSAAPPDDRCLQPLNTNGEVFPPAVEAQMLDYVQRCSTVEDASRGGRAPPSLYWVTPQEASYVFQSPLKKEFLADHRNAVEVPHPLTSYADPILYYNASGAVNPAVYTPVNCQRYDPWNYCGAFYSPVFAVTMKRYAVQHQCMQEARWVTRSRMQRYGAQLRPGTLPLRFIVGSSSLHLVNIALTSNRDMLESQCVSVAQEEVLESAEDAALLVVHQSHVEVDDSIASDEPISPSAAIS